MKDKLMPYLLLAPQILLTILFMIGLVTGITQSLGVIPAFGLKKPTLFYYKKVLSRPDMMRSVLYSLRIALLSSALATAGGVFFCGVCIMGKKTQGAVMRIIQLPIIVPHVVAALFIINIFSRNGILARAAYALGMIQEQQQFPMLIYDSHGLGIIMAYLWKEIPFIIYFIIALMANINGSLGEAATNLGAKTWTVFWRVTLPLCRNTIISGFLIIFVFSLGAYELPLLLGATVPKALPVLAYHEYIHPDLRHRPYAMALNGIIIIISLISALLYFLMIRKNVKCLTEEQ
ncbi:ABC transporter permease [Lacrimispora celerecrescens]|uniref:ABC transporter permease n=1 Tax=Lacrimispora celerecrescens TaxID=29354 RepID=UPI0016496968